MGAPRAEEVARIRYLMRRPRRPSQRRTLATLATLAHRDLAEEGCFEAVRYFAPEEVDEVLYRLTVTRDLHARLFAMANEVREAVARVFETDRADGGLRDVMADAAAAAQSVRTTTLRVPGSESAIDGRSFDALDAVGSAFARATPRPRHVATPEEGRVYPFLAARRVALRDLLHLAWDRHAEPCDLPPLYEVTEANAYYQTNARCVVVLLGVLHAPTADALYDDESLYSRLGFVLAHELAHASIVSPRYAGAYASTLAEYEPSTREEGLADVGALLAIERVLRQRNPGSHAGIAWPCRRTLLHAAQLFCAKKDATGLVGRSSHPSGRDRMDRLERTVGFGGPLERPWCAVR
jgi:hypothetical protein